MKTLTLSISDAQYQYLQTHNKLEVAFIKQALEEKISRESTSDLDELLKEGYKATAEEDLAISAEFAASDYQNL